MKTLTLTGAVACILLIAACHSTKKSNLASAPPATSQNTSVAGPSADPHADVNKGIFMPGDVQLDAIQKKYDKNITLENLREGYSLYTGTECTSCHKPKNLNHLQVENWNGILEDMAHKARISTPQKNAIYAYVLSAKLTQMK